MRVNSINTYSYSNRNNVNKVNNNRLYASKPVFKQTQTDSVVPTAIIETLVEAANDKRNKNSFMSKINFFRDVLFSDETTRRAQQLKEAIESYDSTQNILYKI